MRPRLGQRSTTAAALCLIFLLWLAGCGLLDTPTALPSGESVSDPGAVTAQPTISPTAEATTPIGEASPIAPAQGLFDWFSQHLGRTGLLLALLAVVVMLLAIVVIVLVRLLTRAPQTFTDGGSAGGSVARHASPGRG